MDFWQVDAFTTEIFGGNPAAVFIFDREPPANLLMKIAREMNLSETAFVIRGVDLKIRWFTPNTEVNLCGHATLSAAHILWEEGLVENDKIVFQSRSGPLTITKNRNGYTLDFPSQPPFEKSAYSDQITQLLGLAPDFIGSNGEDCMAVVSSDEIVRTFTPNYQKICDLTERGFLLTALDQSGEFDYIYRGFFPKLDVPEDPVTGSANTSLAPYWSSRLNKQKLKARQVSERGGTMDLEILQDRVLITGTAVTVFKGVMNLKEDQII
ncbi:MAG: PhzF family phenazine biosynthesis protein [Chlamydiales bacterium]|nr:PhzF family phenazine biosynthesis protein [Chlamydiales bacterium]